MGYINRVLLTWHILDVIDLLTKINTREILPLLFIGVYGKESSWSGATRMKTSWNGDQRRLSYLISVLLMGGCIVISQTFTSEQGLKLGDAEVYY